MKYNYREAMLEDIQEYCSEMDIGEWEDKDELEEHLNEELWVADSVTGNASGSYTFNRAIAQEYVNDNLDLFEEAASAFGISDEEVGKRFLEQNFEWMDVTIRCYLLADVISEIMSGVEIG